jgi:hypothetical protein
MVSPEEEKVDDGSKAEEIVCKVEVAEDVGNKP